MQYYLLKLAQTLTPGVDIDIPTPSDDEVLQNGLNIAYFVAGIIAVIVIIIGGIMYATSSGEAGALTRAKNMILYSIVGLVVIIAASAITNFVIGRF